MIPNNNLSILPWYTSIEQQNARKWWVYDRIYPLFTQAMFMLPFQIMREPLGEIVHEKGDEITNPTVIGELLSDGSINTGVSTSCVMDFSVTAGEKIYLENLPRILPKPSMAFFDERQNFLYSFPFAGGGYYTGFFDIPADAARARIVISTNLSDPQPTICKVYRTVETRIPKQVTLFSIYSKSGLLIGDFTQQIKDAGLNIKPLADCDVILFGGQMPVFTQFENGQYYAVLSDGENTWYSEVFTVVNDISPYLKIVWWDNEDFVMDAGTIVYKYSNGTQFRNVLYLQADIAKPEYVFEEEGESRDGYFFPTKQISEKKYRFSFLASEYLLDVMRFIRMADYAYIEKNGQRYSLDTFLITPEWEDNGDVASVAAEFETATVAKKIGVGYIKSQRGDFNDDFNNDFDIQ